MVVIQMVSLEMFSTKTVLLEMRGCIRISFIGNGFITYGFIKNGFLRDGFIRGGFIWFYYL